MNHAWAANSRGFGSLLSYEAGRAYYNPFSFTIHINKSTLWTRPESVSFGPDDLLEHLREGLKELRTEREQLLYLIHSTAWIHEVRHFHDCLCTRAGIHDFVVTMGYLERIFEHLAALRERGEFLKEPLAYTVRRAEMESSSSEHVEIVAELLNIYGSLSLYRTLHNGDIPPMEGSSDLLDSEVVWLDWETPDGKLLSLPTFPARGTASDPSRCRLVPIGFRALTESAAVILQRQVIRDVGQGFVEGYSKLLRSQPEYLVLNYLLTRSASRNGLRDRVDDWGGEDLVYELADLTLHNARGFVLGQSGTHVGDEITAQIRDYFDPSEGRFVRSSKLGDSGLEDLTFDLDRLRDGRHFLSIIKYFALHHCWERAMRENSEALEKFPGLKNEIHRPLWYQLVVGAKLPSAPFSIHGDELHYNGEEYVHQEFSIALIIWLFFLDAVSALPAQSEIRCPIAYRRYGGIGRFGDLQQHEQCAHAEPGGSCGRAQIGLPLKGHVECSWKMSLINWALIPNDP